MTRSDSIPPPATAASDRSPPGFDEGPPWPEDGDPDCGGLLLLFGAAVLAVLALAAASSVLL